MSLPVSGRTKTVHIDMDNEVFVELRVLSFRRDFVFERLFEFFAVKLLAGDSRAQGMLEEFLNHKLKKEIESHGTQPFPAKIKLTKLRTEELVVDGDAILDLLEEHDPMRRDKPEDT